MSGLQQILIYSDDSESGTEEVPVPEVTPSKDRVPEVPVSNVPEKRKLLRKKAHQERKESHEVILKNCGCILKCCSKLSHDRRLQINETHWKFPMKDQRLFIQTYSSRSAVKRRRVKSNLDGSGYKKRYTFKYSLQADDGVDTEVCARFFLNTLGYNEKCNSIIYRAYAAADKEELGAGTPEQRPNSPSSLMETVKADILSYNPTISHYRREHSPNVLYLPSDLSCAKMYTSFNESRTVEGKQSCSYNYYYKVMARLKIRFTKLGHELCEKCRIAEIHFKSSGHRSNQKEEQDFRQTGLELHPEDQPDCVEQEVDSNDEDEAGCKVCATWLEHRDAAIAARMEYGKDKGTLGDLVVSVDLEKVIQLPRMERFKEVIFAKRIVALNETFAPLGGGENGPVQAILWNETISGRKASDIMSTFTKHMESNNTVKRLIYWLDNCASQNKNWDLLLHMILLVNSTWIAAERVTFKYLESGHTFMTADAFHASVERKMRKHQGGELHNFDDFVDCVKDASAEVKPVVTVMNFSDFFEPTICFKPSVFHKKQTRPYLADIEEIRFDRGSYRLLYKEKFDGPWLEADIFTKKQLKEVTKKNFLLKESVKWRTGNRGIEIARKAHIVKKLCPLMVPEKVSFWTNLEECDKMDEF